MSLQVRFVCLLDLYALFPLKAQGYVHKDLFYYFSSEQQLRERATSPKLPSEFSWLRET